MNSQSLNLTQAWANYTVTTVTRLTDAQGLLFLPFTSPSIPHTCLLKKKTISKCVNILGNCLVRTVSGLEAGSPKNRSSILGRGRSFLLYVQFRLLRVPPPEKSSST